ncbi:hypothetical protein SO802_014037 [Lithocarpus litseifolius]|uniref:RNase H type-1 domain-containing protein n=1 Tax=Lithocarpus litseifolius TaxID=425828 RepID=A0AAW2D7Z4_9ROSI
MSEGLVKARPTWKRLARMVDGLDASHKGSFPILGKRDTLQKEVDEGWNSDETVQKREKLDKQTTHTTKMAEDYLKEYRDAQEHLLVRAPNGLAQQQNHWKTPSGLAYKINVDAAVFNELNASGFGVVVRNDKGEVLAALAARGTFVQDSEEAEVLACRRAVEFAIEAGFMEIILEGDNINVMKAIMDPGTNCSRLGYVYDDIRCVGRSFRAFSVSHVRRTANFVAHSLAKFAKHIIGERIWMEESPPPALEALHIDSCNIMNE